MKDKIIDYLLENANASIVLRVKKEILQDISEEEERILVNKILKDRYVNTAVSSQKSNGWFRDYFHGSANMFDNMEVGLRFLAEKGLPPDHPIISSAVQALVNTPKTDAAYGVRKPMTRPEDDYAYTGCGIYLPRSSIILRAGYETKLSKSAPIDLNFDIDFSVQAFRSVLNVNTPDEIIEIRRGKPCFKKGVQWPCIYHLRILAFSEGWRNKENMDLIGESISSLYEFPSVGFVYTYYYGQLKGPCMTFVHNTPINETLADGTVGGMYFDRLELLARCGALTRVEALKKEYELLMNSLDEHAFFTMKVHSKYALGWSPYFGFALEEDWRTKNRQQCDILFRILMIMVNRENTL